MSLNFLKPSTDIKEATDTLGGGFVWDSGAHPVVIDSVYLDQSTGGAYNLNFTFKTAEGKTLSETIYISSGTAKGTLNYYVDKKGVKQYLPGFVVANDIALICTGKDLGDLETEDKMVDVYNPELGKKAPASKPVFMDLIGKQIQLGIHKIREFKQAKNAEGKYVDTAETREKNEIVKVFSEEGMTVVEAKAGLEAPEFFAKWVERNGADYVKDKTKGATPAAGGGGSPAATPSKSLFNK